MMNTVETYVLETASFLFPEQNHASAEHKFANTLSH